MNKSGVIYSPGWERPLFKHEDLNLDPSIYIKRWVRLLQACNPVWGDFALCFTKLLVHGGATSVLPKSKRESILLCLPLSIFEYFKFSLFLCWCVCKCILRVTLSKPLKLTVHTQVQHWTSHGIKVLVRPDQSGALDSATWSAGCLGTQASDLCVCLCSDFFGDLIHCRGVIMSPLYSCHPIVYSAFPPHCLMHTYLFSLIWTHDTSGFGINMWFFSATPDSPPAAPGVLWLRSVPTLTSADVDHRD